MGRQGVAAPAGASDELGIPPELPRSQRFGVEWIVPPVWFLLHWPQLGSAGRCPRAAGTLRCWRRLRETNGREERPGPALEIRKGRAKGRGEAVPHPGQLYTERTVNFMASGAVF